MDLDEHRRYLSDRVRLAAFDAALRRTVRAGSVVLDLGSGTGVLGLLACRHGAARVYAVDQGPMAELARAHFSGNGFARRATVVRGLSTRIELPGRADLVVADQVGGFGFEAGLLDFFADARRRLLKRSALAVPARLDLWLAAVRQPEGASGIGFWRRRHHGFAFEAAAEASANLAHPVTLRPGDLLGEPLAVASIDTLRHGDALIAFEGVLEIARAGPLHGLGGWFSACLAPGVAMTNSPLARRRIARRNVLFPLTPATRVARGDRVEITLDIRPRERAVQWRAMVRAARDGRVRASYRHSTVLALPLSPADLARLRPDSVPALTPWDRARRTVLGLCDGRRTLGAIEKGLLARHGELFGTPAEAAAFVAEVLREGGR